LQTRRLSVPGKPRPLGQSCKDDAPNPQELAELWGVCTSIRDRFIVGVLQWAGLRVGELCHLRRTWVNFEENTIEVPRRQSCTCWECVNRRNGEWKLETKQGIRTIRINPLLRTIMLEFFEAHDCLNLTRQRVWQIIKELCRRARIGPGFS